MPAKPVNAPSDQPRYFGEQIALAMRIIVHPNIRFAKEHISGVEDLAYPRANMLQTAFLLKANRSCYGNAPCGEVPLTLPMLRGMLELAQTYSFHVTEIAGGAHGKKSRHYKGVAFDVDVINGVPVSAKNDYVKAFQLKCKALGATEVLGPGHSGHDGHVHCAWPRPK